MWMAKGIGRGRSMDYGLFPCRGANTLNPAVDNAAQGKGQTVGIGLNNCGIIIKTRNGQSAMGSWRLCACNVQRATGCTSSFKGFVCGSSNFKHAIYRERDRKRRRGGETYVQGVSMR